MASFSTSGLLLLVGIVNKSLTVINMLLQYFNMDIWIYLAFDMCTTVERGVKGRWGVKGRIWKKFSILLNYEST